MNKICARFVFAATSILIFAAPGSTQTNSRDRILRAIDATDTTALRRTAHPLARPQYDLGRVTPAQRLSGVSLTFRLSPAQQSDLDRLLREQQDPASPNHHKWLTADQYARRFGMTRADLAKVTSWLQSQGLKVDGISRSRNEVSFSGSVGQIEYALKTEIHNYSVGGEQHFANANDISLPSAFYADVVGVRNLDNFRPKPRVRKAAPRFTSNLSGNHFLIPGDFAQIYDLPPTTSLDGTGQKIAVVGQTNISNTDIDAFRTASGLAKNDPSVTLVPNTGTLTHFSGDETESDLDLEWAGAIAPKASIIFVTVGNNPNFNVFDALDYAIQQNLAPVISISYGNCEANLGKSFVLTMQQWAQHANAQGQTISGPSGDDGAADCDFNVTSATHGFAVDVPASIPEVTGIGGTEFTGDHQVTVAGGCAPADSPYWSASCNLNSGPTALQYIPETTWNDPVGSQGFSAGGGGASSIFGKPSWQTGTGVPNDGKRDVPDISLNSSNTHDSYLICSQDFFDSAQPPVSLTSCTTGFRASDNQSLEGIGGTSAGAPAFAGILALINQATSSNGLGNVNPMLYRLAATTPGAFHDVNTSGTNKVPCTAGTTNCPTGTTTIGFTAGPGYDQVTGLGSLDVSNLITAWLAATPAADFSLDGLVSTVTPGVQGTSTITITAENGFAGTVNLTCSPSSSTAHITCALNPTSVTLSSSATTQTATLTISTVAMLETPFAPQRRGVWFAASGGTLFAAVVLGTLPSRRRRWAVLFGLVLLAFLAVGAGCGGSSGGGGGGGGGGGSGTPAGTYSITVTGTGGATSHSTVVSLTVQ
jgi:subtilase family serine protease